MIPEQKRTEYLERIRAHYGDISNSDAEDILERIDQYARLLARQINRINVEEKSDFDSTAEPLYDVST